MSYTLDYGFTRSSSNKNLAIVDWDYSDFTAAIPSGNEQSREFTYVNKTGASDRNLKVIITIRKVADAYKNTKVNPAYRSASTEGESIQLRTLYTTEVTDSDTGAKVYLPVAHTQTVTWVKHPAITASVILQIIKDTLGLWFPTDSITANQIADFIVGGAGFLDETTSG